MMQSICFLPSVEKKVEQSKSKLHNTIICMYFFQEKNIRLNVFFFLKNHFRKLKRTKFERCESDFF